ncbi:MAG: ACT domain-containing protein [Clostridia bacterium]|nr:ACT domain-containing protein [Clostridia bacterium]
MSATTSKAIITVIGTDAVGIIAKVSGKCSEYGVNIIDITQKVFENTFAMIMQVDTAAMTVSFVEFTESMKATGKELGVVIHATHEDIFNAMHRI